MIKLAFMIRISLTGEDLNNEGSIGNTIQPRQIDLGNGIIRNAISGEMLKHYHQKNVRLLSDDNELCDTCKIYSPMKNGTVKENKKEFSKSGNKVRECVVCDIEGFMNAGKGHNEKRTSCVHFSWAISTNNGDYGSTLHTRIDPTEANQISKKDKEKDEDGNIDTISAANTNKDQNTQMIFNRVLRSNIYAETIVVDLDRIGFDDEKLKYTIEPEEIKRRKIICIKSIRNMFMDIEGALCSTRTPHLGDIKGIVVIKNSKDEVLSKYSALTDDFIEVNKQLSNDNIHFENILAFSKCIDQLVSRISKS